ncbi:MAG: chitobiase/beta-hexosaminidase C-terminal domain-containing protein, partial [Terracidiphilus sp.]
MNADGMTTSDPLNVTVAGSLAPIPVLSPIGGTYNTIIGVVITVPGYPGATIYYTTGQTIPAVDSLGNPATLSTTLYTGPITLTNTCSFSTNPPCPNYFPGEEIAASPLQKQRRVVKAMLANHSQLNPRLPRENDHLPGRLQVDGHRFLHQHMLAVLCAQLNHGKPVIRQREKI